MNILYHPGKANVVVNAMSKLSMASTSHFEKRELEFEVDDWVYLKVSPMKGVMRFGKKGKHSPWYIDPYRISNRIGNVAYELELPQELATVHPILDRQVCRLRTTEVASVEVLWRNQFVEEATWEDEENMKKRYPHLFEPGEVPDQVSQAMGSLGASRGSRVPVPPRFILPLRTYIKGCPARRNVEEQGVPNAPEVQPQGEVTNAEFREVIRMLSQAVTKKVRQRENRQEGNDTSRIREFLRMNPPSFTGSSTTEDPENLIEELQKIFEVMHVIAAERVELATYQLKNVATTWFDQWKKSRAEDAPILSWAVFESTFLGHFFPRELREAKVREFLTLKQDSLCVHEYGFKLTVTTRKNERLSKSL
ncbi:hypothetical protein MTR67_012155 [Solanum verrucosum]|uniref:Retrotransposon gag domain-containing protein n=1 Tax=Solanum verrucosum TaxID=315347 RepID=A0AAF0QAT3_SOLVR|nr:hypothetical protein MTR67_012155 [Solanum verrucosum]